MNNPTFLRPSPNTATSPLERGSTVIYCAVCIQAGRVTEATHQTRDLLCGCDQHIQQLEQHGLAALRRARKAASNAKTRSAPAASSARGLTALQAAGGGADDLIEQATGIIMNRFDLDAAQALQVLRRISQSTRTHMCLVAEQVIDHQRRDVEQQRSGVGVAREG